MKTEYIFPTVLIALACALLLCGCDNPDFWEYQVYAPKDATPERLMEIERLLLTNGYKRVRIVAVDLGRAVVVHATKKEGPAQGCASAERR